MGWTESYLAALDARDEHELHLKPLFEAFSVARDRAIAADRENTDSTRLQAQDELLGSLRNRVQVLEAELKTAHSQIDASQTRVRNMAEEQYLKTHHVETLHDEIMALTLQLSIAQQRLKDDPLR